MTEKYSGIGHRARAAPHSVRGRFSDHHKAGFLTISRSVFRLYEGRFSGHQLVGKLLPNKTAYFLFASYYGQKSEMPNAGAKKFPFHLLLQSEQGKMAENRTGQTKKAANLFQTYCFRWPPVAAGIQF